MRPRGRCCPRPVHQVAVAVAEARNARDVDPLRRQPPRPPQRRPPTAAVAAVVVAAAVVAVVAAVVAAAVAVAAVALDTSSRRSCLLAVAPAVALAVAPVHVVAPPSSLGTLGGLRLHSGRHSKTSGPWRLRRPPQRPRPPP